MLFVAVLLPSSAAFAQDKTPPTAAAPHYTSECPEFDRFSYPSKTFYLKNVSQANDANEILTGLRLMLDPMVKLYLVPSQSLLVLRGCPAELTLAAKFISEMDRPRRKYRLTYTITESENGKKLGIQHVALTMEEGQRTTLKNGSKVPIVTGSYNAPTSSTQTQMTYLDIGVNFDATATAGDGDEITLKNKFEQSSVAEEKSGIGPQDPVVRQSVLESVTLLTLGKPQVLGSMDITGSTRHLEIEALLEPIK